MTAVEQILKEKGNFVYSIEPENTILDALKLMADKNIGAVLVMKNENVLGIFSERDYARRGTLQGNPVTTYVKDVMTRRIYYISPDQTVEECMALMNARHFRHLPVLKDGKVIGVISISDVVKTVLAEKDLMIKGLENSIISGEMKQ